MCEQVKYAQDNWKNTKLKNVSDSYVKYDSNSNDKYVNTHGKHYSYMHHIT